MTHKMEFYDLCLRKKSGEMQELAETLGWSETSFNQEAVFLTANDWGELKRKIGDKREEADVLVFSGGNEELNRKVAGDSRIDIILHPERDRKDSGMDHVIAEKAADNNIAIGFDLQQLFQPEKQQTHVLRHWKKNLALCEKYEASYIITSGAEEKMDLRTPRELAAIIESLGYDGNAAVSENPGKIIERNRKANDEKTVRSGVKVEKGEENEES